MSFSMFLRSTANLHRGATQCFLKLPTSPAFSQRAITSSNLILKETKSPLLNCAKPFSTSQARLSAEKGSDHSKLWLIERITAAALLPLVPLGLMMPNKLLDCTLAVLITAHSFWGLEAIAVDYVRASVFGPVLPKIAIGLVYLVSIATLGGLFFIITHDVGLANTVRQLWSIKPSKQNA